MKHSLIEIVKGYYRMSIAFPSTPCRFPLSDPRTITNPIVRAVYAEIESELGFGIVPNIFRAMSSQPAILRTTWDLFRATVLQGALPRIVKEMIGIVVSVSNHSEYALKVHLHSLSVQDVDSEILTALASGGSEVPGVSPSIAAIIKFAHKAAYQGPGAISDADVLTLLSTGITQAELYEVFASIHLFQYVNNFTDLVQVPVDAI